MQSWVTTENGLFINSAACPLTLPLLNPCPGVNTTVLLAPPFMRHIRQDNIPKRRLPDPLSNLALHTFGPTTPETVREIPWMVIPMLHAMATTNMRVRGITRINVLSRDHPQTHFRTHMYRERRVIADLRLDLPRSRIVLDQMLSKVVLRVHVPRSGPRRVVREGVTRHLMVIRRKTKLQQRVG